MKEIGLEERKKLQLEMMDEVDSFCRKNNLTYYLAFGSLIGAVRHKGYIPWDDDMDIMMPRDDYNKFAALFPRDGIYRFLVPGITQNYPYAFGKIIDIRTVKNEPIRSKYQVIGLDVDVFPIDNYPDNLDEAVMWCEDISRTQKKLNKQFARFSKGRNIVRTIAKNMIICFWNTLDSLGICTVNKTVLQLDKLSTKYNTKETNYCGISAISTYGVRKRNRKLVFDSAIEMDFEGHKYFAPSGYDEYLTDTYGDYMQLPPVEKRKTHHINKVYWK